MGIGIDGHPPILAPAPRAAGRAVPVVPRGRSRPESPFRHDIYERVRLPRSHSTGHMERIRVPTVALPALQGPPPLADHPFTLGDKLRRFWTLSLRDPDYVTGLTLMSLNQLGHGLSTGAFMMLLGALGVVTQSAFVLT